MKTNHFVEYVAIQPEDMERYERQMRRANVALKRYHTLVRAEKGIKRQTRYSRQEFRTELFEAMGPKVRDFVFCGVSFTAKDLQTFRDVENLQPIILHGFSKLIFHRVRAWFRNRPDKMLEFGDLYSEVMQATIHAMIGYTKRSISFKTYLYRTIQRHLHRVTNRYRHIGVWSNTDINLYREYLDTLKGFNCNPTFDEIVEKMGITRKKRLRLTQLMRASYNGSSVHYHTFEGGKESKDHTDFSLFAKTHPGMGVNYSTVGHKNNVPLYQLPRESDIDIAALVMSVDFTDIEKIVFEAAKSGGVGWQSRVAEDHINPKTGKPYTRMTVTLVVQRIKEKLQRALDHQKESEAA